MSSNIEHVADLVDDYLHALLSPQRAAEVEQHCRICPTCQAALEAARRRRTLLQSVPPSEASPQLVRDTLHRIGTHDAQRRRRMRRFFVGSLAVLAACALILLGLQIHYSRLTTTPYDLLVLGQRTLLAGTNSSLRIRLLDTARNAALSGVPVIVQLDQHGRRMELARFDTDAHGVGQPRFQLPDWPDGEYKLVVTAQTPAGPESISRSVRLTRSWKLMLTSDKPIYQPGQTIHVRALALRQPDLRPVAEQETIFTLTDPKGNILFKQAEHTSRYGIAAVDCVLAKEIAEGSYTLACKIGDSESRQRVEIRPYVLPKFKVEVRPDRSFYQPKETVHLVVQADYFFGKPVAGAAVDLEIREGAKERQRLSGHTDEKGTATFEYALSGDEAKDDDKSLSFLAHVADSAGQKESGGVERIVTRQPVRIEVLPENGKLVRGVRNVVYLLVTRADGTPVQTRLTIEELNRVVSTDANGLASCEIQPTGEVTWTITARDADDKQIAQRIASLSCAPTLRDFLLRTDRAVYESGQSVRLSAEGNGSEPVFVDVLKDGQTLLSETIAMKDGHGVRVLDLPSDLFGTVQLCAYRLDAGGARVNKTRVLYIRPANQLHLTVKANRHEYRPGRRAHLDLTLTDANGKACPGAISLAGVDEAVFSVLSQRLGSEETFYSVEQPLLQPVYALYPWSPEHKAADGTRLEQALFSATVHGEDNRSSSSPHSLAADSLPEKVQQVQHERAMGFARINVGWIALVCAGVGVAYASLWLFLSLRVVKVVHGFTVVLGVSLLPFLWMYSGHKLSAPPAPGSAGAEGGLKSDIPVEKMGVDFIRNSVRIRKEFPETLLWKPQILTDDAGRAHLDFDLADSITTWRIRAGAVAVDGRLGATQLPLKVFQPFFVDWNLPLSLTRNDEVSVPVAVYNYLDKPQSVALKLKEAPWFTLQGKAEQRLELAPREVRSISYRIQAKTAGMHALQVEAAASGIADALQRNIEIVPEGRRVEQVFNGTLQQPGGATLLVPDQAIEGSVKAFLKIYPSNFSQIVEGLDNIFQMPYGCFEQTSSTTYPNILALDYLKKINRSAPQIEEKAQRYIHLGYQRLLGFEIAGGGFDWFGRAPANRTLTAYGLMEFQDMARVSEVDPRLIERTRRWLLSQRKSDGSWAAEDHLAHDAVNAGDRLATTAYIAWAVFAENKSDAKATHDFLLQHTPDNIRDPYLLALLCNALLTLDPHGEAAMPYLERLEALKHSDADGKHIFWRQPEGGRTTFYGSGRSGDIETTALATLALLRGQCHPGTVRAALAWLIAQKDARGTWHSTQATVLTLKALLATTEGGIGGGERRIVVRLGDKLQREIVVPVGQAEVLQQLDLSSFLSAGRQRLELIEKTTTGSAYQMTFRYHLPETKRDDRGEPFAVHLDYERKELILGQTTKVVAKVSNRRKEQAAMVMVELPLPPRFAVVPEDFTKMVESGRIARCQFQNDKILVYLRHLTANAPLELNYHLRATLAGKVQAAGARVYEYYNPDRAGHEEGTRFTVTTQNEPLVLP